MNLDIAVIARRGLALTRGSRNRLGASVRRRERQGQASGGHRCTERKDHLSTP